MGNTIYILAIIFTVLFVIKLLITLIGGFDGVDLDFDSDADLELGSDGFALFTIDGIFAFIVIALWTYIVVSNYIVSNIIVGLIAFVAGVAIMFIYAYIMKFVKKLDSAEIKDVYPEIGSVGSVYLGAKPNLAGKGKFEINGQLKFYAIVCDVELITGTQIEVIEQIGDKLVVQNILK